jgi:hypothetical protein
MKVIEKAMIKILIIILIFFIFVNYSFSEAPELENDCIEYDELCFYGAGTDKICCLDESQNIHKEKYNGSSKSFRTINNKAKSAKTY